MKDEASIGIRPFQTNDVLNLLSAARESMAELQLWLPWCHPDFSLADSLDFVMSCGEDWAAGRKYRFAIYDRADGAFVGSIGLNEVNRLHGFANLTYWVRSSRTGQGIASTGIRLVAPIAFEQLHLNRLQLVIAMGNRASIRVAEKVGAHREGVLGDRILFRGRPEDAVMYSLLAEDRRWEPEPQAGRAWNTFARNGFAGEQEAVEYVS